ncbi:MAG: lysozyme [Methanobrevibacter sp.]|nr:lysozyme [Methanobrevibacter sp.]
MIDDLIRKYEGCKLQSYKCPAGIWTIGWGTTYYPDGTPVKKGEIISQEVADMLLDRYIQKNITPVFEKIPYKLTDNQKCAIASLCYNVGVPSFLKSKCFSAMCKKDWAEMIRNYDWGFKQNLKGLFKRRIEELHYFIKDI